MSDPNRKRENWGTRVGVILAVTGSAVGLGNFLRFPGLAARYEGGAFMIPYFVAFLLLGLPIAWAEWGMGRYGGSKGFNSMPGIFSAIVKKSRVAPFLGVFGIIIPVMIYMYYVYIEAWCLGYAWNFATGAMALGDEKGPYVSFFLKFVGLEENGQVLNGAETFGKSVLPFLLICFAVNFALIWRGLNKGIEWFCRWAMPALVICALIVLVRVMTLPGVTDGLAMTWNPTVPLQHVAAGDKALMDLFDDSQMQILLNGESVMVNVDVMTADLGENNWEISGDVWRHEGSKLGIALADDGRVQLQQKSFLQLLGNAEMWLAAAGQIFFSLSVGLGLIITYSSYLKRDDDVALSSMTASAGNGFCEVVLGGLITIPAAFLFLGAAGVNEASGSLFNLGFMTLPMVFEQMPAGQLFGFLFFFLLFLAAVTSSLSMLQPAIAFLEEGLGLGRHASVAVLGFVTATGTSFVVYFSAGAVALDTIDFWIGTFCIYVIATIQVILFGWIWGIERGMQEIDRGSEVRIPRFVKYLIKYVAPVYLLVIFGAWIYQNFFAPGGGGRIEAIMSDTTVRMSVGLIILTAIFLLLLISEATRRWRRIERERQEVQS